MKIDKAEGLPKGCRDVFCQYKFPYPTQTFTTPKVVGGHGSAEFNYKQRHSYDYVSQTLLDFLLESSICIKLYGYTEGALRAQKTMAEEAKKKRPEAKQKEAKPKEVIVVEEVKKTKDVKEEESINDGKRLVPVADKSKSNRFLFILGGCCALF